MKKRFFIPAICIVTIVSVFTYLNFQYFLQDENYGTVKELQQMHVKRSAHTATLLTDGRVMLCGGIIEARGDEINTQTMEFFNPGTNNFVAGASMHVKRAGHTATLFNDSNILVTGGFNETGFLKNSELYNAKSGTFEKLESVMSEPRASHTATLLPNGRVAVIGGVNGGEKSNCTIDVYNPETKSFEKVSDLVHARTGHTASLLPDGTILIAGGSARWRSEVLGSCEIFDPVKGISRPANSLHFPRNKQVAISLANGDVMIVAGSDDASRIGGQYNTTELFQYSSKSFVLQENKLRKSRFKISNAGVLMENGNVLVAGDGKYVEVYVADKKKFRTVKGNLSESWMYPTVTALKDNKVLIAGGYNKNMEATARTWLYSDSKPKRNSEIRY